MSPRSRRLTRQPDRAATEAALQGAALDLLDRNGVLAGLNLREVAEEAGVNRGLVYHYFGSRRALLRAALRSDYRQRLGEFDAGMDLPFPSRIAHVFRTFLRHRRAIVLAALLVLDGDQVVRILPDPVGINAALARDVADGNLPDNLDVEAAHVSVASIIYGYLLFRDRFAAELETPVRDLDERMAGTIELMLAGRRAAAPGTATNSSTNGPSTNGPTGQP
jgi:AcrR family transcriptional regulator